MSFIYKKARTVLNFKKDKPVVYKVRQIVLPQVSTDDLYEEISQSCGVPVAQSEAVINALTNRLIHFVKLGHPVRIGKLGSLNPKFRSKTTRSVSDADAATVTGKVIQFIPGSGLKETIHSTGVTYYKSATDSSVLEELGY